MSSTKPAMEIRLGLIKAAIFKVQTRSGERFNVTLTRLFKDGSRVARVLAPGKRRLIASRKSARHGPHVDSSA